jgi:hypothetical protein
VSTACCHCLFFAFYHYLLPNVHCLLCKWVFIVRSCVFNVHYLCIWMACACECLSLINCHVYYDMFEYLYVIFLVYSSICISMCLCVWMIDFCPMSKFHCVVSYYVMFECLVFICLFIMFECLSVWQSTIHVNCLVSIVHNILFCVCV